MSDLLVSIQSEFGLAANQKWRNECTIYRVPKLLRRLNEDAFTPLQVSIGPFHHKNERLLLMETYKLKYVQEFFKDSTADVLKSCIGIIRAKEEQIRDCYAESFDMSSDDFVRMVLIDAIFIIQVLILGKLSRPLDWFEVRHDLRLAENQHPFFILKELYCSVAFIQTAGDATTNSSTTFIDLACQWLCVEKRRLEVDPSTNEPKECCHFVDLQRSSLLQQLHARIVQRSVSERVYDTNDIICPTATSLHDAGVKFRVTNSGNLLDIGFNMDTGVLTLPELQVGDDTEELFRNVIAFEQCHYHRDTYLTNYVFFMDCLIDSKEDVHLLAKEGIIHNFMGSDEELASLINTLCTYARTSSHFYYTSISKQLKQHSKKRWNRL
ncbi:hypothetical protein V2J09_000326 [Rumex salicifolius]